MKLFVNQKALLLWSVAMSAAIGLSSGSVMAHNMPPELLAKATLLIVLNTFFGAFDVIRPAVIKNYTAYVTEGNTVPGREIFFISLRWGALISAGIFILLSVSSKYFTLFDGAAIAFSALFFLLSSGLWGVMDLNARVGSAYLIRAIGTSALYVAFALSAVLSSADILSFYLLAVNFSLLGAFLVATRRLLDWRGSPWRLNENVARDAKHGITLNFSRMINDFSDRLFMASFASPAVIGVYNLMWDIAAKTNISAQLITSYSYPQLCKAVGEGRTGPLKRFLIGGALLSGTLLSMAGVFALLPQMRQLLVFYGGEPFDTYYFIFPSILAASSIYALAFFGQGAMWALGFFKPLSRIFLIVAIFGSLMIFPLYHFFGLKGILIGAALYKSSGVLCYAYLIRHLRQASMLPVGSAAV